MFIYYANLNTISEIYCIFNLYHCNLFLCDYLKDGEILKTDEIIQDMSAPFEMVYGSVKLDLEKFNIII